MEILSYLDGLKEGKQESNTVRAALVASGKWRAESLFPDWFDDDGDRDTGGDVDYDYQEVVWESPSTTGIEEFERLQQLMRATGVTLHESEGPVQEAPAFFASDDDESAEWV